MNKRLSLIILLFISVLVVVIIGNHIHIFFTKKAIDYKDEDAYNQYNKKDLIILIEVDKKQLFLIDSKTNKTIKTYGVATGKSDFLTPLGTFKIIEKGRWGGGFGSRWLGLDVPWGQYGIHGTNKPGSIGLNASDGCVRMRNKDVEELYDLVEENTIVSIINGNYGPFGYGLRDLKPGDRGADVIEVQKRLKANGYYTYALDGIYGEEMKNSVSQYLKNNNMPLTHTIGDELYKKLDILLID